MDNVTSIALSRLVAQQRANDVSATNLANAATPGFHAERMVFSDWLVRARGTAAPGNAIIAFTQDRATYRDTQTGPLQHTANPLDLAIGGDGYFSVQTPNGVRLTRAGHFSTSANGDIVDGQGNALLTTTGGRMRLTATTDLPLKAARLWVADAPTRDFRKQTWAEAPAMIDGKTAAGLVAKPEKEWRAFFMECEYEEAGKPFFLSTQIRMEVAGK